MPLVQMAVNNAVGEMGIHFITFAIFAFAFSSLIGNYFYAESNLRFIKGDSRALLFVFRLVCLGVIFYGAVNSFDLAWNLADIFMGFMAIVNLVAIVLAGQMGAQGARRLHGSAQGGQGSGVRGRYDRRAPAHRVLACGKAERVWQAAGAGVP